MVGGLCNFTCNCFSQDNSSGILKYKMYFQNYSSKYYNKSREELNDSLTIGTLYIEFKNPQTLFANIHIPI